MSPTVPEKQGGYLVGARDNDGQIHSDSDMFVEGERLQTLAPAEAELPMELSVKASTQLGWQGGGVPQECLDGYGATNTPRPLISLGMPMDMSASSTSTHPCAHSPATVANTQM